MKINVHGNNYNFKTSNFKQPASNSFGTSPEKLLKDTSNTSKRLMLPIECGRQPSKLFLDKSRYDMLGRTFPIFPWSCPMSWLSDTSIQLGKSRLSGTWKWPEKELFLRETNTSLVLFSSKQIGNGPFNCLWERSSILKLWGMLAFDWRACSKYNYIARGTPTETKLPILNFLFLYQASCYHV